MVKRSKQLTSNKEDTPGLGCPLPPRVQVKQTKDPNPLFVCHAREGERVNKILSRFSLDSFTR